MYIYYIVLFLSGIAVYCATIIQNKFLKLILNLTAILIPSLIAGFRDTTVGMDLAYYAVPCFEIMCNVENWDSLLGYILILELEPLYVLYNYLITRFTEDIFWALFIQQILVIGLVLYTCFRLKRVLSVPALYSIFILLCYVHSMTTNRQIFAIAMVFFSFYYILTKKTVKYSVAIFIAILFHYSAVIALPIYWIYNYSLNLKIKDIHLFFIFILGIICFIYFPAIIQMLINWGLLAEKYIRYADKSYNAHTINIVIIVAIYMTIKLMSKRNKNNIIYLFLIIVFFMYLCGVYNDVATRVAWYYLLFAALLIMRLARKLPMKSAMQISIVILFAIQFVYLSITTTFADAIPYTSSELNIKGK